MPPTEYMPPELLKLAKEGDGDAAEELLERNKGMITAVVRRFSGRLGGHCADESDLFQIASIGFIKAIRGFEPELGYCFSTYAMPKIIGEVRRFLRDDGMIKLARGLREGSAALNIERDRLCASLGREPTVSELSSAMGIPPEEVAELFRASAPVDSLDRPLSEDGRSLGDILPCSGENELLEKISLRQAIEGLDSRSAAIIRLRFFSALTQQKTAERLGVSQVQVSRLEARTIQRLRELMTGE